MELAQQRVGVPFVRAAAQFSTVLFFGVLPLVLVPLLLHAAGHDFLWDFRREFLPAGRAVLRGDSPYPHSLSERGYGESPSMSARAAGRNALRKSHR